MLWPAAVGAEAVARLVEALPEMGARPGLRLDARAWGGALRPLAARVLGPGAEPVRAVLFDKRPGANWAVGWHQDRTVALRERRAVADFGAWSVKDGVHHAEPPFAVLQAMVTLRLHLDAVGPDNAPLLVVPGSHRLGCLDDGAIGAVVARGGAIACLAGVGDVWMMATPIVHASERARAAARRRVLQVDFAATALPGGLAWAG